MHFSLYDSRQTAILCRNLISLAVIFGFYRSTEKTNTSLITLQTSVALCFQYEPSDHLIEPILHSDFCKEYRHKIAVLKERFHS